MESDRDRSDFSKHEVGAGAASGVASSEPANPGAPVHHSVGLSRRSDLALSVQAARHSLELAEHSPASSKLDAGDDHDEDQAASHYCQLSGCVSVSGTGAAGACGEHENRAASKTLVSQREKEKCAKCCYMYEFVVFEKIMNLVIYRN